MGKGVVLPTARAAWLPRLGYVWAAKAVVYLRHLVSHRYRNVNYAMCRISGLVTGFRLGWLGNFNVEVALESTNKDGNLKYAYRHD